MARPPSIPPKAAESASPLSAPLGTVALVLLGLAACVSAWLAYQSLQSGPVPGCNDGDCGVVLSSKWAKVFGVPVGIFGAATYLALALLARRPFRADQRTAHTVASVLVLLIPAAGLWFAALQLFVLEAFCKWCSGTHAVATTGAILVALCWRRHAARTPLSAPPPGPAAGRKKKPPAPAPAAPVHAPYWGTAVPVAAIVFGTFVLAQVLGPEPPKRRIVTASMPASPTPTATTPPSAFPVAATNPVPAPAISPPVPAAELPPTAVAAPDVPVPVPATATAPPIQPPSDTLALHGGRFVLRPAELPRYGDLAAPHRAVMISDYTCIHCRHANRILAGVRETLGPEKLCVTVLPTQHGGDSLEIQEMMLAAWQLDPKVWSDIGTEIYHDRLAPKAVDVRNALLRRLDPARLAEARKAHEAWTTNLLATTKQILVANREITKSGSIPQFIIGTEVVVGSPDDDAEFYQLFEKNLGLVRDRFPELSLVSTQVNLGRIFAGTSRVLSLSYSNTGKAPLRISRVSAPPGGKVLRGLHTPIAPGNTGVVELTLAAPRDPGAFDQPLTLYSNARSNEARLRIAGTVWKPIRITPSSLDFGRLDADNVATQAVLRLDFDEPARIASVRSQNSGFSATLREIQQGRAYEVVVATTPSLGVGSQQSTLMVALEKPVPEGWPESLALSARATVDRAVSIVPQRITLPAGPLANERHLQALVRCSDSSADFKVISAILEGGPAFTQPEIQTAGPNGTIVRFTLPAGWSLPAPPVLARLVVQTTHPRIPTLEVPLVSQ